MVSPSDRDRQDTDSAPDLGLDQFESISDEPGISLEELSEAYAQLMGKGADPYEPVEDEAEEPAEEIPPVEMEDPVEDDACELCPRSIVESILFVGHPHNEPITGQQIAALMRGVPEREIDELIRELNDGYDAHGHPYHIVSEGAGYRMVLRAELASLRDAFYGRVREARLSQAAIDVLAIVAYQQGLTREEIDRLSGKPSGGLLSQLVRRQLLKLERPEKKPRRPRYYTTDRFLALFGLAELEELPRSQEVEREF